MTRLFFPAGGHCRTASAASGSGSGAPGPAPSQRNPATPGTAGRVIDDDETVRGVARTILERAGFTVVTAASGAEGIARLREAGGEFSLVLLDMKLPMVTSQQVCDALVRIRPEVRIVLSSGYLTDATIAPFSDKEIAGYLQKPYRFEEPIACVQRVAGPLANSWRVKEE